MEWLHLVVSGQQFTIGIEQNGSVENKVLARRTSGLLCTGARDLVQHVRRQVHSTTRGQTTQLGGDGMSFGIATAIGAIVDIQRKLFRVCQRLLVGQNIVDDAILGEDNKIDILKTKRKTFKVSINKNHPGKTAHILLGQLDGRLVNPEVELNILEPFLGQRSVLLLLDMVEDSGAEARGSGCGRPG